MDRAPASVFRVLARNLTPGERIWVLPEVNGVDALFLARSISPYPSQMPGWLDPTAEATQTVRSVFVIDPAKKVRLILESSRKPLSLETPTDDEEDSVLGDFIEDDEAPPPDETATYNLLREHLEEVLNTLPPREVRILQLRFGLVDGYSYTLEEVGKKLGVTRERVRQIEAQALSRLRHPTHARKLRDYLRE